MSLFDPRRKKSAVLQWTLFVLLLCGATDTVNAYDQQIASSLSAEGYSVYRRNGERLSRRRFVEDLSLAAWNIIPGETDPYYKGPRLSIDISFRIFTDTGITREESTPRYDESFVPGIHPVDLSALTAYIDGRGFWNNVLDVRAGRQIRLDSLGFFAFDGIDTRLRLPIRTDVATYVGLEVRGGQQLGYSDFELDGTDKGRRAGYEQEQYPDRESPRPRLAMGMELRFFPWQWLDVAAAFRAVGINDGADNLADERVGGQIRIQKGRFRGTGRIIYSPLVATLSEGDAELTVRATDIVAVSANYYRFVPVFEGDSIFNVFDLEPQNDVGGRVAVDVGRDIDLATWGFARLADKTGGISGDETGAVVAGFGSGVGGNYRTHLRELSLRFTYVTEWGEKRLGTELGAGHAVLRNQRLWLGVRASYFHVKDDFSELYDGDVVGYILSARFNIAKGFRVLGEFEHYFGDNRSARMSALALLELDVWR